MTEKEIKLKALKEIADKYEVEYAKNTGFDRLYKKTSKHLESIGIEVDLDLLLQESIQKVEAEVEEQMKEEEKEANEKTLAEKKKEMNKLIRCIITNMDPNMKDWRGEIFTVGNAKLGSIKKYVPFGVEWHIPEIILNALRQKKYMFHQVKKDAMGNTKKTVKLMPKYGIQILPPLTEKEIKELARNQKAREGLED
jgi:hypothetical protein